MTAIRNQCCQWEQDSADAVADGRLSNAVMLKDWAFAADLLASTVASEFTALFSKALDARMNWSTPTRSIGEQVLDALAIEVACAQCEPEAVPSA
ncbi:hypothetical protein NZK27_11960 [Synechococcus sp. FGCU-3]|nr:hypothetical protein [Synechococcus sp. FGCU3]